MVALANAASPGAASARVPTIVVPVPTARAIPIAWRVHLWFRAPKAQEKKSKEVDFRLGYDIR
jgi:hypothetical protein